MSDVDANEFLMSGGIKSASFAKVGDSIVGVIARQPETRQQRDFATGEAKFWDDGKPRLQIVVVLKTDQRDADDSSDTGERALYIKSGIQQAVAAAVRSAGAPGLEVGGKLFVKFTAEGKPATKGLNPPKIYEARYKTPEPGAVSVELQRPDLTPEEFEAAPF